uniref:SOWAHA-C winged helix-turn-helix domain-containing protein n=1 Tax=Scleropages formosus TaxID=113540 RepID=A0A8C9SVV0_SCLFO
MALSQGAVLSFLRSRGGRVRNAELLGHFWRFLREGEHEDRARNRELFKRFVNAVAVVQQQRDGAALVVLRRKFREKRESPSRSSSSSSRRRRSSEEVLASAGILHLRGESACEQQQHQPPKVTPGPTRDEVAVPLRSGASRSRRELRSRMCRSLGADLDQPFPEDVVSARRNRLYLLSSSLSINYPLSTYSRTHRSPAGPEARSGTACAIRGPYGQRSVPVPLDPKEHDWLLKAASGSWTEIYALFREEPTLLDKRDFISGYTLLHWIAKHGDHRVLNTLWYGVNKAGMDLDVDARTTCGYTPLHLAAIHGHKKMIRLLVHKFKAKVTLRDTSGKRPWQYLASSGSGDLLQLLGSPKSGNLQASLCLSLSDVVVFSSSGVLRTRLCSYLGVMILTVIAAF